MPANYDKIARVYDLLSRMVFGGAIASAQVRLLEGLPTGDCRLLIVGGGTGWILEELGRLRPEGIAIDYIEASGEMIALSKKRNCGKNTINFVHTAIENFEAGYLYRVIVTPFVLDNFKEPKLKMIFDQLDNLLEEEGTWLYADFVYGKTASPFWQKILLKIMYFFFRLTAKIEANELLDVEKYFAKGYQKKMEAKFYFDFIKAVVYEKL
jgi:ubiquinone/menaquinone biosynthesis C-methylase UbiE